MKKDKFLATSLPYELKCLSDATNLIYDIISCHFADNVLVRVKPKNERDFPLPISQIKPILHPLSDLTKEIEHKEEKFVPIKKIAIYNPNNVEYFIECIITGLVEYIVLRQLIEWHFDVADLISKGEAIDVNTLEVNPYK